MIGYPTSVDFVGWTGVHTGSGARSSQPTLGEEEVTPHDQLCLFFVPSHFPVFPSQRTTGIFRPAPFLAPAPTPLATCLSHLLSTLPLPLPPAPPSPTNPGDSPAARVNTSAHNTFSKAWVSPQPRKAGPVGGNAA